MSIVKIFVDVTDTAANVVTVRFEEGEMVRDALVRVATKLKLQRSAEEIHTRFAFIIRGVSGSRYFPLAEPIQLHLCEADASKVGAKCLSSWHVFDTEHG